MGAGIVLLIVGAIFTFAVRGDTSAVDLQTVGLILMTAGGLIVYFVRNGRTVERETTTYDDLSNPNRPAHTVHETVTEHDFGGN